MSNKNTPVIETDRLLLRGKIKKDAPSMLRYYTDEAVRQWLGGYPPTQIEQVKRIIRINKSQSSWVIIEKKSGCVIGEFDIYRIVQGRLAEMGYILLSSHWGKGYMSELMTRMIAYAFDTMGLEILRLSTMSSNTRCRRLALRMGFTLEAELHNADFGGRIEDVCYYSLTRSQYEQYR